MKNTERENGIYFVGGLGHDQGLELSVDEKTPWLSELLAELEEDVDDDFDQEVRKRPSYLKLDALLEKRHTGTYGDFFLLTGEVEGLFNTYCVSTGASIKDPIHASIRAIFLESHLEKELELEEETELFHDDSEFDLYYYDKRRIDLKAAVNEYLFLNKDPYPRALSEEG